MDLLFLKGGLISGPWVQPGPVPIYGRDYFLSGWNGQPKVHLPGSSGNWLGSLYYCIWFPLPGGDRGLGKEFWGLDSNSSNIKGFPLASFPLVGPAVGSPGKTIGFFPSKKFFLIPLNPVYFPAFGPNFGSIKGDEKRDGLSVFPRGISQWGGIL